MTPEEVRSLFAYDAWANERTLDAAAALTTAEFTRGLGSSFGSVRDTLAHIVGAQWIWCERFNGRPTAGLPKANGYPDAAALRAWWGDVERGLLEFVEKLSAADLDGSFDYHDTKGNPHRSLLRETLQHLVNHGTYHRGQVTTLLRQLGAKPVSTDLMVVSRERAGQSSR